MTYSLSNFQICNAVVLTSDHAVHYIPMPYLLYNWMLIPFDTLYPFCPFNVLLTHF